MRKNEWQSNPWGVTAEVQRADLWRINFSNVLGKLRAYQLFTNGEFCGIDPEFYAQSLVLPAQTVRPEVVRRDSRPYNMPSWDEPLDAIRLTLLADVGTRRQENSGFTSEVVKLFTAWRALVRSGRGGMSLEDSFALSGVNFSVADISMVSLYAFDIPVYLLKGGIPDSTGDRTTAVDSSTDLDDSTTLKLVSAWLSSIQFGELSHVNGGPLSLSLTLYADDILQPPPTRAFEMRQF